MSQDQDQDYTVGTPVIFTQDIFNKPFFGNVIAKKGWKGVIKNKVEVFSNAYEVWHIKEIPNECIMCNTDQLKAFMNKETLLHYLRLPYNVNVDEMRKARDQAADELERLYELEKSVNQLIIKLEKHEASCVHE